MRFKVKDLLITILPKKTVIADAECHEEDSPGERGGCGACTPRTDAGFGCGGCTPVTDPTGLRCGGCTPVTDPTGRIPQRPGVFDIESHRQELERQLRALRAYEEALEEEPTEAELTRAVEALSKDEERLEEALAAVRSLREELEEKLREREGG